jgi:hypothetical protein
MKDRFFIESGEAMASERQGSAMELVRNMFQDPLLHKSTILTTGFTRETDYRSGARTTQ